MNDSANLWTTKVEDVGWGITRTTTSQKPLQTDEENEEDDGDIQTIDHVTYQTAPVAFDSTGSSLNPFADTGSGGILRSISAPNVGALWRRHRSGRSSAQSSPTKHSVNGDVTIEEEEEYSLDLQAVRKQLRLSLRYRLPALFVSFVLTLIVCTWYYFTFPSTPRVQSLEKLHKPVADWSNAEVLSWLDERGFSRYRDKFQKEGVDGKLLMYLDERDMLGDLEMSTIDMKRALMEIDSLRMQENDMPRDLWEYRRQNPFKTQVLGIALQTAPRPLLLYLFLWERENWSQIFWQGDHNTVRYPILSILGSIVMPELVLATEVIQFLPLHPVIVSIVVGNLVSSWLTRSGWLYEFQIRKILADLQRCWLWVLVVIITFPFTPRILQDIFFFLTLIKDFIRPTMFLCVDLWLKFRNKPSSKIQLSAARRKTSVSTATSPYKPGGAALPGTESPIPPQRKSSSGQPPPYRKISTGQATPYRKPSRGGEDLSEIPPFRKPSVEERDVAMSRRNVPDSAAQQTLGERPKPSDQRAAGRAAASTLIPEGAKPRKYS